MSADGTIQLTDKGRLICALTALEDLAERYGEELTWQLDLASSLRWQINWHKSQARELQERIDELTEQVEELRDDNMNLEAMLRSAHRKLITTTESMPCHV